MLHEAVTRGPVPRSIHLCKDITGAGPVYPPDLLQASNRK
jgi:hypothetical protein